MATAAFVVPAVASNEQLIYVGNITNGAADDGFKGIRASISQRVSWTTEPGSGQAHSVIRLESLQPFGGLGSLIQAGPTRAINFVSFGCFEKPATGPRIFIELLRPKHNGLTGKGVRCTMRPHPNNDVTVPVSMKIIQLTTNTKKYEVYVNGNQLSPRVIRDPGFTHASAGVMTGFLHRPISTGDLDYVYGYFGHSAQRLQVTESSGDTGWTGNLASYGKGFPVCFNDLGIIDDKGCTYDGLTSKVWANNFTSSNLFRLGWE